MTGERFDKERTWRVIAARHPPIALFELVADRAEFDALHELEAAFSPHYDEVSLLEYLPRSEWVFGPGAGYVMAPFAYRSPSRFSDGSFGVYYAGLEEETAIQEVAFHRGRFLEMTREVACIQEEQVLQALVSGVLLDIRGEAGAHPELYAADPAAYAGAQAFGAAVRRAEGTGLVYASVRHPGGTCVGLFRPKAVSECRAIRPLRYLWDGAKIASWA